MVLNSYLDSHCPSGFPHGTFIQRCNWKWLNEFRIASSCAQRLLPIRSPEDPSEGDIITDHVSPKVEPGITTIKLFFCN